MKIDSKDMLKKIGIVVGGIGLIFLVAFGVNFSGKNAQINFDRSGEMEYYESPMPLLSMHQILRRWVQETQVPQRWQWKKIRHHLWKIKSKK